MIEFEIPKYWKGNLNDVEDVLKLVKKGKVTTICKSAGNRPIYLVEYGEKSDLHRKANYCSAMGARSSVYYADKSGEDYKPCVLFVGSIHGNEWEGTVALNNLLSIIETGVDLAGDRHDELLEALEGVHLLIVPCANPDGRARVPLETMAGQEFDKFRYYSQGTWKDGSLCGWLGCKSIHPIKDATEYLGGYFNDDGVNIMHDNFFSPYAEETKALLNLADEFVPDMTILLHGGDNTVQGFFPFDYVPGVVRQRLVNLSLSILKATEEAGLDPAHYAHTDMASRQDEEPVPCFGFTSAWTALCGEPCITYESNQGLDHKNRYSMDEIYAHHMVLFNTVLRFVKAEIASKYKK